jgi:AcrR family transcriptional regulator
VSPIEPGNARSRRTRAALLSATRSLLEERGFEALTMAAVADRAGVSRRAIYLHFPSRTDLVEALFDYVTEVEQLGASTRPVWDAPDSVTALQEWAGHIARFHVKVRAVTRAVEQMHREDPDAASHRARYLRQQLEACRRLARWLKNEEQLVPAWTVESAAEMLWALISTDLLDRLLDERHWSQKRLAQHYSLLLHSTFVTDTRTHP